MRRFFSVGVVAVLAVLMVGIVALGAAYWRSVQVGQGPLKEPVTVMVQPGSGTAVIARDLQNAGVVRDARAFRVAVRLSDDAGRLKAGEYVFEPGISMRAVIEKLARGDVRQHTVTFPEGWTVRDVVARLEATETLSGTVKRPAEGSIFPDTYSFHFGSERAKVLENMQVRMKDEVAKVWAARDPSVPLNTPDELVTLASIVQKEAASDAEMPRIAGVFVNRLRKGMKLQSDPTVIYGAEGYGGDIRRKDLKDENPFNTYIYAGLPPTPIANPGKAALMAAAHPVSSDELFFVADATRTGHMFSATYEQHLKYVKALIKAGAPVKGTVSPSIVAQVSGSVVSATTKGVK